MIDNYCHTLAKSWVGFFRLRLDASVGRSVGWLVRHQCKELIPDMDELKRQIYGKSLKNSLKLKSYKKKLSWAYLFIVCQLKIKDLYANMGYRITCTTYKCTG